MAESGELNPFRGGSVLLVAFEGWNDAGEAASGAVRAVRDQLALVTRREVEPEDYFDYQFNRPEVSTNEDGERVLEWPSVTLSAPVDGVGVHVLLGTEPSRGWKTFSSEIIDAVEAAGITGIVFLGAMLADVPHTRPVSVSVTVCSCPFGPVSCTRSPSRNSRPLTRAPR